MAIRSRKTTEHRVTVESWREGEEPLTVTVRSLRPAWETYLAAKHDPFDQEGVLRSDHSVPWAQGIMAFGLTAIHDAPIDPDTGRPLELAFVTLKIDSQKVQVLAPETVEALSEYAVAAMREIMLATHLTDEEKRAIPFTSSPAVKSDSPSSVPNVSTVTPPDAPPSA